ncbi:MAG: hypothetical protein AAGJ91_06515 [Pseudomonadota bacterium]
MQFRPADFRLLIGTHTFGHITAPFAQSLATLTGQLGVWGVGHAVHIVQDAFVTTGRDRLAQACLEGGFTHLLLLDADLEFKPEDVARLLAADVPLVAGVYPRKEEGSAFAVLLQEAGDGPMPYNRERKLLAVDGVGAGFMLIRAEVFRAMAERLPEIAYLQEVEGAFHRRYAFFEQRILANGHRISEDILFCRRWRALGGTVWVAPDLRLRHWGMQVWDGTLADSLSADPPEG